jgi:predicted nucleic acid-binding protein
LWIPTSGWRLLDQARSAEVGAFLDRTPSNELFITDFAFHSIGVVLNRLNRLEALARDTFVDGDVTRVHLEPEDTDRVINAIKRFKLDFDDAYHYAATGKYSLTLVSFDTDFDQTDLERKTPGEIGP